MWLDQVFQFFNSLMQGFIGTPTETIALVLGAGGVSILTQLTKRIAKLEKEKVVVAVFTGISFVASLVDYLVSHSSNLPPSVLGVNTAIIMGIAQPIYYYGVKPFSRFYGAFKQYQDATKAKIDEIEAVNTVADIDQPVLKDSSETPEGTVDTKVITPVAVDVPKTNEPEFTSF